MIVAIKSKLTLGPLYYHWPAEKRRDFYFKIADEAPLDEVYLGEVVCSKRESFFEPYKQTVIERLQNAGKKVILSSLAMINTPRERKELEEKVNDFQKIKLDPRFREDDKVEGEDDKGEGGDDEYVSPSSIVIPTSPTVPPFVIPAKAGIQFVSLEKQQAAWIEVNDVAAIQILKGHPFIIGPHITILNEGALGYLVTQGAKRIVFSSEMNGQAMARLASQFPNLETEAQVFGRQPLAIAMRCYSARAKGRDKDHCRFACGEDMEGIPAKTMDGTPVWQVNGTQTLSAGTLVLAREMLDMQAAGVTHFRLSPQDMDMVAVAKLYCDLLEGKIDPATLFPALQALNADLVSINGFYHGAEGHKFVESNRKEQKIV